MNIAISIGGHIFPGTDEINDLTLKSCDPYSQIIIASISAVFCMALPLYSFEIRYDVIVALGDVLLADLPPLAF